MVTSRSIAAVTTACALTVALVACSGERPDPVALRDPCGLITDDLLARLAPGSERVPEANIGDRSGSRACNVDLTSGSGGLRGDLGIEVSVDGAEMYDEKWRADRCAEFGATPAADGPGDTSCFAVTAWDGSETRIDGWAWVGDDHAAKVGYQLVQPQTLPAGAEQDLRALLASATESLPTG
jgi:hypothetical protein